MGAKRRARSAQSAGRTGAKATARLAAAPACGPKRRAQCGGRRATKGARGRRARSIFVSAISAAAMRKRGAAEIAAGWCGSRQKRRSARRAERHRFFKRRATAQRKPHGRPRRRRRKADAGPERSRGPERPFRFLCMGACGRTRARSEMLIFPLLKGVWLRYPWKSDGGTTVPPHCPTR